MEKTQKNEILRMLEKDCRLSAHDIAVALGLPEAAVAQAIAEMEAEAVICGYHALVNWDKVGASDEVTAMVELRVTPQGGDGYNEIAREIAEYPQVETLYLMSGGYDYLVILHGHTLREISLFISDKLASIEEVQSTTTHFILTKYKETGVTLSCRKVDGRMVITP